MFEGPIPELELTRVDLTLPAGAKETRVVTRPTSSMGLVGLDRESLGWDLSQWFSA
jgi:hypothetical protein